MNQPFEIPDNDALLQIARDVGLREHMHGVNATAARELLRRFLDAVIAAPVSESTPTQELENEDAIQKVIAEMRQAVQSNMSPSYKWESAVTVWANGLETFASAQAATAAVHTQIPAEPVRIHRNWADAKLTYCSCCGQRLNCLPDSDATPMCSSCFDGAWLAEWQDYAKSLRLLLCAQLPATASRDEPLEPTVRTLELASRILVDLGYAVEPSLEPGADGRRYRVAAIIAGAGQSKPQKFDDTLLPFLALMRRELHANTGKGDRPGWLTMSRQDAICEIYYHVAKLQKAMRGGDLAPIAEHAADVANMTMMALDVCGGLPHEVCPNCDTRLPPGCEGTFAGEAGCKLTCPLPALERSQQ